MRGLQHMALMRGHQMVLYMHWTARPTPAPAVALQPLQHLAGCEG